MREGLYYKLDVYDVDGQPLTPQSFEFELNNIIQDAQRHLGIYTIHIIVTIVLHKLVSRSGVCWN